MNFIFVIALLLLASLTAATAAATAAAFQAEEEWTQLRTNNRQAQDTMMGGATAATAVNTNNNNTSTGGCSVCSRLGSSVVPYTLPWGKELLVTCGEYEQKITETVPSDSPECSTSQDTLEYRCCKQAPSMLQGYECESNVRSFVLNDSYDATVAPLHSVNGTTSAVEVTTHFSYFNVKELDVKTSTLEIFVMVLLQWNDPRLAWDRDSSDNSTGTNDNCATRINVRADYSIEETEIWVPSLDLVNRASSFQDFPPERAEVRPDGTVTWRRLGSLRAICAFVGLRRIPFDDVGCRLVFMNYDFTPVNFKLLDTGNNRTRGFEYVNCFFLFLFCVFFGLFITLSPLKLHASVMILTVSILLFIINFCHSATGMFWKSPTLNLHSLMRKLKLHTVLYHLACSRSTSFSIEPERITSYSQFYPMFSSPMFHLVNFPLELPTAIVYPFPSRLF